MAARKMKTKVAAMGGKCAASAPQWMLIAAFALLAVLALALVYRAVYYKPPPPPPRAGLPEGFFDAPRVHAEAQLVFLHMDGCGWCDRFKPQWDAFVAKYGPGLTAGGVTLLSLERKDPRATAYGSVDGYPTIIFVTDGGDSIARFGGERTPEGLIAFVRENGYGHAVESFYEEPDTGGISKVVSTTKGTQDGKASAQTKAMQNGAGGKLN